MKLTNKDEIKRLGIFFFYDKDGVVDDYVMYMLNDMVKNTSQNIVVCNGKLTDEGKEKFESLPCTDLLVRDNKGFDVWAYKSALEYYGWDVIDTYDEIFMYNFTIMGPIDTFKTMFDDMDARDLDFWGMTIHNGAPFDPWGNMEDGTIPIHIQSHFIAVRNSMIKSEEFHKYWDERPMIKCYEDAVGLHETIFTKTFENAGFKWNVYVDTEDLIDQTFYPLFNMPVDLIKNRKCPIFKRKLLINDFSGTIQENANLCARELFDYLKNETNYDTDMILAHLLRSANLSDLVRALNLNYILDEKSSIANKELEHKKYGIFISTLGWENHTNEYLKLIENIPDEIDLYLLTDAVGEPLVSEIKRDNIDVTNVDDVDDMHNNQLLEIFKDTVMKYELVCIMDNYGFDSSEVYSNILAMKEIVYRDMLESREYIHQILQLFEQNSRLGMLVSNMPVHGRYYSMLGNEWNMNYKQICNLLKKSEIDVMTDKDKEIPIAVANCCWVRTKILKQYLDKQDILFEVTNKKNRIVNMKRSWSYLLPLMGQNNGYYTATVSSNAIAQNLLNTFYGYANIENKYTGMSGNTFAQNIALNYFNVKGEVYYDTGTGFMVDFVHKIQYKINAFCEEKVKIEIEIPQKTKYIRFDPCEGFMCLCSNVECDLKGVKIHNSNGVRFGKEDLFLTKDPQYILEGDFSNTNKLIITMDNMSVFWSENGLKKEVDEIYSEREELIKSIDYLTNTYNEMKNSNEKLNERFSQMIEKINNQTKKFEDKENELKSENEKLQNEISILKNSKSWRWTAWLRRKD